MTRPAAPPQELHPRLAGVMALLALASTCRGERVHFRIHAGDLHDQHSHTRTVLLHPGSETLRQLRQLRQLQPPQGPALGPAPAQSLLYLQPGGVHANPQQPVSFMRQTLQLHLQPRQPQQQQQPVAGQRPQRPQRPTRPLFRTAHGHPGQGLGATHIQQVPLMPIIPLTPLAGPPGGRQVVTSPGTYVLPDASPHPALSLPGLPGLAAASVPASPAQAAGKNPQTHAALVTHQMPGPGPWPMHMLLPHGPKGELVPMKLIAVAHAAPTQSTPGQSAQPNPAPAQPEAPETAAGGKASAALLSVPSVADLKKGTRCKGFVRPGEDPEAGDCFLEEYENGYNEAHSSKTFFGDKKSNSKHQKGGARNTKRYKNESKITTQQPMKAVHVVGPLFRSAKQMAPMTAAAADPAAPARVTVVRLPPGATAVTTVMSSSESESETEAATDDAKDPQNMQDDEEEDERASQQEEAEAEAEQAEQAEQADQSLDPQRRGENGDDEGEGLVEVFKQPKRAARARLAAPLIAVSPAKSMWVQELHPVRIKQMDADEDEYEAEESAPAQVVMSPEQAMARALPQPRGAESAAHPRALDDMDLSWGTGFSEDIFNEGEPAESENMEAEVDAADFDHSMDGDDKESDDDDDGHDEQDHSATELVNGLKGVLGASGDSHSMMAVKGPSEKMVQNSRVGPSRTDHDADSPRLGAILASGGHVFAPTTPPPPHPAAFGARDPDRLESGRRAPVVVEFGHELSDFKETRERQQKKW